MKVALVNPPWSFEKSIYFGCREPHLPVELGYARALLEAKGHAVMLVDAQLAGIDAAEMRSRIEAFAPDFTAITTAPSYLFWRCAPPELRVPRFAADALRDVGGRLVAIGPHGSVTPRTTRRKLGVDAVVVGECEEALVDLADTSPDAWSTVAAVVATDDDLPAPAPRAARVAALPPLRWDRESLARHTHHHHRFERPPEGMGAELEASRGCPYHCTFCAKERFRDDYRKRPLDVVLEELDGLLFEGVRYVYFIDEIFLPNAALLEALAERDVVFGVQLRIDNWSPEMLDLLGKAGCVSVEAGVESLSAEGRSLLQKRCRLSTDELTELLLHAKRSIPFVQANLLGSVFDDKERVRFWREGLKSQGVWANEPVPLFPYPGSPEYSLRWGPPDGQAWERAHEHYLKEFSAFSDIQDDHPLPLDQLEGSPADA
jgi:B12-binding domain/radical SAM domain protein of rhizo-twelve system